MRIYPLKEGENMSPLLYLCLAIAMILVLFAVLRRPMYEVILLTFLVFTVLSGHLAELPGYFLTVAKNSTLYSIVAFIAFSAVMSKTGVIEDFLDIVVALVGRFSGGAGYVAIAASSIMGSLSGSAPGNAASVGSITIPAMKKTGYSPELAAVVGTASSSLGMLIPPSAAILTIYGILTTIYPSCCTLPQFWMIMWGMALWLILQRIITLIIYIKKNRIGPISKEDRPDLKAAVKKGWKAIFLPVLILLPFLLDSGLKPFYQSRLGNAGASMLSGSLLVLIPSIASAYVILIAKDKSFLKKDKWIRFFSDAVMQIVPVAIIVFAGFALGELFDDIGVGAAIGAVLAGATIPRWFVIFVVPIVWMILGMFLEPLMILLMVGETVILLAASVGINPILMAAASIAMGHVMANMTPPFATTFFVCMGIAEADFVKSTKMVAVWCVAQYICVVLIMLGILPVMGMVPFTP